MAKRKSTQQASNGTVEVDIVSDIVCPWCWLGTRYFFEGVRKSGLEMGSTVKVTWRPYMLDPTVPTEGVPYKTYMQKKFGDGPSDKFKAMRTHLETAGPDAGITFRFSGITVRPNTLNAHRLMKWAQGQDKGTACAEALFKAVFDDLSDIGNADILAGIATSIGMDGTVVKDLLVSPEDRDSVQAEIQFFRGLGISGVPTFIYNGQLAVQGAQPAGVHLDTLRKARTMPASLE